MPCEPPSSTPVLGLMTWGGGEFHCPAPGTPTPVSLGQYLTYGLLCVLAHSPQAHDNPQEKRLAAGRWLGRTRGVCWRRLGTGGRDWGNLAGSRASARKWDCSPESLGPPPLQMTQRCRFYTASDTAPPPASSLLPGLCCCCRSCCCRPCDVGCHM